MTQHDDVRVGTPERERAIGLLNDAFSSGYLEISEFEERSGGVYVARTRGDLKALVADLPDAAKLFPDNVIVAPTAVPVVAAPLAFDIEWDTVRRKGSWHVPSRMLATGSMGTLDLDFRHAVFASPVVELEVQISASAVKIRIGDDQEIRIDVARSGWSTIKDKAGSPSRPGGPLIMVRGSMSFGSGIVVKR